MSRMFKTVAAGERVVFIPQTGFIRGATVLQVRLFTMDVLVDSYKYVYYEGGTVMKNEAHQLRIWRRSGRETGSVLTLSEYGRVVPKAVLPST